MAANHRYNGYVQPYRVTVSSSNQGATTISRGNKRSWRHSAKTPKAKKKIANLPDFPLNFFYSQHFFSNIIVFSPLLKILFKLLFIFNSISQNFTFSFKTYLFDCSFDLTCWLLPIDCLVHSPTLLSMTKTHRPQALSVSLTVMSVRGRRVHWFFGGSLGFHNNESKVNRYAHTLLWGFSDFCCFQLPYGINIFNSNCF